MNEIQKLFSQLDQEVIEKAESYRLADENTGLQPVGFLVEIQRSIRENLEEKVVVDFYERQQLIVLGLLMMWTKNELVLEESFVIELVRAAERSNLFRPPLYENFLAFTISKRISRSE